jgi:hypothetical protein
MVQITTSNGDRCGLSRLLAMAPDTMTTAPAIRAMSQAGWCDAAWDAMVMRNLHLFERRLPAL